MQEQAKDAPIWALGAMSGTSLDGVDAAMLQSDGHAILGFGDSGYRAYSDAEQAVLRTGLGRWPGEAGVAEVAELCVQAHAELLAGFEGAALVGFHGQTLAHDPGGRGTHQVGDGAALAARLGLPVAWDFRSADVRLGGQGAPLAPFFHFACAKWIGATAPLCFLNLGGVGNITWVDPRKSSPEEPGALLAFDTGPANAPINDLMQERRGLSYDKDGALAAQGEVVDGALELFLDDAYFPKIPPKSLDRDAFADMLDLVRELGDADAAATMTGMAATAVMLALDHCPTKPSQILVTGGGRHNPVMMQMLQAGIDCPVKPVEAVGLDGDMLEAQAFAYLAIRVAKGLPTSSPETTGVSALVGGGTVSHPG
ncbi:anhydro-N-acetylmuramic acid kinase [Thalassovita sp.]|uniref:anhydro-N-acetylmuramic acid kinase n=1 Tax=Thalassovita sp. TaxID=1979401 RepID=UPI002AB185F8|nr:anhydro-N-acetylmuramic acid kinase [Thalassovita sp.]